MGEDQREGSGDRVGGESAEVEVLDHEDPVFDVEDLRHPERPVGVLGRNGSVAPGVATGQRDVAVGQPLRQLASRPGLTREIDLGLIPMAAPPRVKEHRVTGLGIDLGAVLGSDHLAGFQAGDVDQPAPG